MHTGITTDCSDQIHHHHGVLHNTDFAVQALHNHDLPHTYLVPDACVTPTLSSPLKVAIKEILYWLNATDAEVDC